jgi:hypothetical protein
LIFNFLIAEITPVGFNTIQYRYYIIYAAINAFIIPVVYFCFPETNGRSLEEMDEIFARSKNIFDPPRIARALPRTREAGHTVVDSEKSVQNTDFRKKTGKRTTARIWLSASRITMSLIMQTMRRRQRRQHCRGAGGKDLGWACAAAHGERIGGSDSEAGRTATSTTDPARRVSGVSKEGGDQTEERAKLVDSEVEVVEIDR